MMQIAEADWRRLSKLKPLALERICSRILQEVTRAASEQVGMSHERYLTIFGLIEQGDKQIGRAFDDLRRSNALSKLAEMRRMQLITEEEFEAFSDETRSAVAGMR
ncbi:MAG: peptide ABC transporter substrate-binding protein [Pseudomonadota bacterium]|nr:peptide ABC transporter substrate-binding protein [Pseudomonadota bacterium]